MLEQVESLQAGWIREVRRIGVGFERYVGVRGVLGSEVSREVVEPAIVCFTDERDVAEDLLGGFRSCGRVSHVAETVLADAVEDVSD